MNSIMTGYYPIFEQYQAMRNQLMEILTDADLDYQPGGANPPLGTLCRELGEAEYAYIQSFKTFKLDFSYHNDEPGLEKSVARLAAWFAELDQALKATVAGLAEEDIQQRQVDRGSFALPPNINLTIYNEALLIFYGKVIVYLRAAGKPVPQQWADWLG